MTAGTLTLERFNGREVFPITKAELLVLAGHDGEPTRLNFEIATGPCQEHTTPDEPFQKPEAEVYVPVPHFDPDLLVGTKHLVPVGDVDGDWHGRICYFEHEPIDENEVEILGRDGPRFHVRWAGLTQDVNFYDGSKPKTRVLVDAVFTCEALTKETSPKKTSPKKKKKKKKKA